MKFTRCDGSTDVFLSAFAVEYPVLTTASPDQVGFDSQNFTDLMAGFKIKLMPDIPASIFW